MRAREFLKTNFFLTQVSMGLIYNTPNFDLDNDSIQLQADDIAQEEEWVKSHSIYISDFSRKQIALLMQI